MSHWVGGGSCPPLPHAASPQGVKYLEFPHAHSISPYPSISSHGASVWHAECPAQAESGLLRSGLCPDLGIAEAPRRRAALGLARWTLRASWLHLVFSLESPDSSAAILLDAQ